MSFTPFKMHTLRWLVVSVDNKDSVTRYMANLFQKLQDEGEEFYLPSCYPAQENFARTFCAITEKSN